MKVYELTPHLQALNSAASISAQLSDEKNENKKKTGKTKEDSESFQQILARELR